jgi:DNA-binding CsgD family transcriptional regulator
MGRTREAMDLVLEQLAKLRPEQRRPRAVALRVLAAASPVEQRVVLLEEAVELLDECGDRFEMAIALADLSAAHRALGDYCQARALAERAHWLAEVCGAEPLRQRLLAEVSDTELRMQARRAAETSPIGELSDAELRVAALAVQGYTNREIAKKLFVTVSTVEQHLTRVYRKLKVRRRTDLPAELQEHLSDATPVAAVGESGAVKQPRLRWSRPARTEPANGRRVWTAAAQ